MSTKIDKETFAGLTSSEISSIWAAYMNNSMELRFFQYFIRTIENDEIRKITDKMLNKCQKNIKEIKDIFNKENLAIPVGFTDMDVNISAPKVFSDTFVLCFCNDRTLLALSTYPSALSDCTRKDVRSFFQTSLEFNIMIQNEIVDLMLSKGIYLRPPQVAIENIVDFIDEKKYLSGLFGGSRPVNTAEIANISRIIHRAQFSKMIFVAFSKLASSKELGIHFSKGRDEIQKVLDSLGEILEKENIPISASSDFKILDAEVSPFSDKLMLFFVNTCLGVFCFTMISQATTSSFRSDIVLKTSKIMNDMKQYYGDGLKFMIKEGWLEKPPQSIDTWS
jgi:hypothetical protein